MKLKLKWWKKSKHAGHPLAHEDHLSPIAILHTKPELEGIWSEMLGVDADFKKRIEELNQMGQRFAQAREERTMALWNQMVATAKEMGLLPACVIPEKTHHLGVVAGILVMRPCGDKPEKCSCPLCRLARKLEEI